MAVFYAWLTPERSPFALYQWFGVASPTGSATPATQAIARQVGQTRVRAAAAGACRPQG
jgi:hypothetical protein